MKVSGGVVGGDRSAKQVGGRPLTALERAVLSAVLTDECPDVAVLREQLRTARVASEWMSGSPSVDFIVGDESPPSSLADNVLPMRAYAYSADGAYLGEIIVWLDRGRLSALEYAWVTDAMPRALPDPSLLQVSRK